MDEKPLGRRGSDYTCPHSLDEDVLKSEFAFQLDRCRHSGKARSHDDTIGRKEVESAGRSAERETHKGLTRCSVRGHRAPRSVHRCSSHWPCWADPGYSGSKQCRQRGLGLLLAVTWSLYERERISERRGTRAGKRRRDPNRWGSGRRPSLEYRSGTKNQMFPAYREC